MAKLDPIVSEFATTEEAEAYDAWFREKVREARADKGPRLPHDQVMAEMAELLRNGRKPNA